MRAVLRSPPPQPKVAVSYDPPGRRMPLASFHPLIARWFTERFAAPTDAQRLGWPEIFSGRHALIAAPTGSGKTLAAFLVCIDRLLRQSLDRTLADETQVVYVSPLKALSSDVQRNLERPLAEITAQAVAAGHDVQPLRVSLRTGDTPAAQRQAMLKRPPHILVTTPESLYLLLTSERGLKMLRNVRTVIVDEIHALARDKRGSHLALSLERLSAHCAAPPVRIGLSATQRPMDEMARFLVGSRFVDAEGTPQCGVIDIGHARELDLAIETPPTELSAVCSHETWAEIYQRLCDRIKSHRSTLVFVNTRRLAERVGHHLSELLGADAVASHHGSLSRELRLSAETRLQSGELKVIVATASLELGIDVGFIDLVCQIGSPRSIATFLQRVGRSGHSLGRVPKGRIFALTRDELLESMALVRAVRGGRLDKVEMPQAPLDILAQQMVAEVAAGDRDEDSLFELCRGAWPYHNLERSRFDAVLAMLSEGLAPGRRQGAYLHRDRVHGQLRARRGARLAALTSGGAIPELADYRVVTADEGTFVGSLNEDFAIESLAGDVFQLGNSSWRIMYVRGGQVVVQDAQSAPATIPFWLGEAPGRTMELSAEVSELREELAGRVRRSPQEALDWLRAECGADEHSGRQAVDYVAAQLAALDMVPTRRKILFERFFDESGGMQLVIHAPLGARVNRAWGLALRKRFCRSFDFELQASADDNGIVLSLGPQHSFPIDQLFRMLHRGNGRSLLVQALLAVPMFQVRWRWNVTRALAVLRQRGGQKVPPHLQRFRADDLLSSVFPAQTACQENVVGDIEVPDHPLIEQTVHDCLHEAMDIDRWLDLLGQIETGATELIGRDTREPSPFSYEILNANPYAFLDDAPLEERRARAVATRRTLAPDQLGDLAWLDPEAVSRVTADAWPMVRDADELHDCLLWLGALPAQDGAAWERWFEELVATGRATRLSVSGGPLLWVAAERWSLVGAAYPVAESQPVLSLPEALKGAFTSVEAKVALIRGRMEIQGPTTAARLAELLGLRQESVDAALEALEGEGAVLRGHFSRDGQDAAAVQWCDRRLLARIHRLTLDGARRRVQAVEPADFWRFLIERQHVSPAGQLSDRRGLLEVVAQLQGFEAPAGAWERDLLPGRLPDYDAAWLDDFTLGGEVAWGRLLPPQRNVEDGPARTGLTRAAPLAIFSRADLAWLLPPERACAVEFAGGVAGQALEALRDRGALFFSDLLAITGLLESQLSTALGELAALGLVSADGYAALRGLVTAQRHGRDKRRVAGRSSSPAGGGRWSQFPPRLAAVAEAERVEQWARQLLLRYGVMFRDLLARESLAPAWRDLARVYRRWEAQGQLRGGRFVRGVAGEQFASPEAVDRLRRMREQPSDGAWVVFSAADPLNLAGILTPGARVPSNISNSLAVLDGRLVAWRQAGEIQFVEELSQPLAEEIRRALRVTATVRNRWREVAASEPA